MVLRRGGGTAEQMVEYVERHAAYAERRGLAGVARVQRIVPVNSAQLAPLRLPIIPFKKIKVWGEMRRAIANWRHRSPNCDRQATAKEHLCHIAIRHRRCPYLAIGLHEMEPGRGILPVYRAVRQGRFGQWTLRPPTRRSCPAGT